MLARKAILAILIMASIVGCGKKTMDYFEKVNFDAAEKQIHVLSISIEGERQLIGTYGKGAYFSTDSGKNWRRFAVNDQHPDSGLSLNYVMGGAWHNERIVIATLGDGIDISTDFGKTWKRLGYNFFGVEYLYTVGVAIQGSKIFVPTADGIVVIEKDIDPAEKYDTAPYKVIDERNGLSSQYVYDLSVDGEKLYAGTLHGFSFSEDGGKSWRSFVPNGKKNAEGVGLCKVRAVAVKDGRWYAGCDDGLFVSTDSGNNWLDISQGLPSPFVHDLLIDRRGGIWVATYKGVAFSEDGGKSYRVYNRTAGFFGDNINCLAEGLNGQIYAGTNYGLYKLSNKMVAAEPRPTPQNVFDKPEPPAHQWFLRPVAPDYNDQKDQTYLYGATMGGYFRQHQGCEFNNPEGVPLRAVDDGIIVYVRADIGHSVLKCDKKLGDNFVYVHYHHQCDIVRQVGQKVNRGDIIGHIGKLGNVTNEHLHFEVSLSKTDDSNVPNKTVNNELWVEPLEGCGTIVGNVVDKNGRNLMMTRIYGVEKPVPTETPFSFAESYGDSVNPSPIYNENFVIADVPAGEYLLWVEAGGRQYAVKAVVEAGLVTRTRIVVE